MRRNTTEQMFQEWPALRHVLQECAGCHAIGLKPGILKTKHGDYGLRDAIKGRFEELRLGPHGLCDRCAEESGVPNEPEEKA
jgi:hypothetical protein